MLTSPHWAVSSNVIEQLRWFLLIYNPNADAKETALEGSPGPAKSYDWRKKVTGSDGWQSKLLENNAKMLCSSMSHIEDIFFTIFETTRERISLIVRFVVYPCNMISLSDRSFSFAQHWHEFKEGCPLPLANKLSSNDGSGKDLPHDLTFPFLNGLSYKSIIFPKL